MSSSQQLNRNEQYRGDAVQSEYSPSDAQTNQRFPATESRGLGGGTDVNMGEPVHRSDAQTNQSFAATESRGLGRGTDVMEEPLNPSDAQTNQSFAATESRGDLGSGTDVMGEPVNPSGNATNPVKNSGFYRGNAVDPAKDGVSYPSIDPHTHASAGSHTSSATSYTPTSASSYESATPYAPTSAGSHASAMPPSSTGFPSAQMPAHMSTATSQPPPTTDHQSGTATQTPSTSPYVQTSSLPGGGTGKSPMDSFMQVFNKWSKKAEEMTGNYWSHLKTGPNVADTALGRIAVGTKAMTEGGLENVFRQTFEVAPEERLLKTYACFLSTSTGPVAGTLYISSHKLAFCSDRPLAIPGSSHAPDHKDTPPSSATSTPGSNASNSTQQKQEWCFYKVMVPVGLLESVNPSENTQKRPPEKFVQVKTVDGHEFWFMGFVHFDKGVKNLQETLLNKNAAPSSDAPTTHVAT